MLKGEKYTKYTSTPLTFYIHNLSNGSSISDKNIILDLDETLIHTFSDSEVSNINKVGLFNHPLFRSRYYTLNLSSEGKDTDYYHGIFRPYYKQFLRFCLQYFKHVIVWSAGETEYVHAVVDKLFKDLPEPFAVFTRPDCVQENKRYIKPLSKIFESLKEYDISGYNTFILDDNEHTFIKNPYNSIHIPAFDFDKYNNKCFTFNQYENYLTNDECLRQVEMWMKKDYVLSCKDVKILDRTNLFYT